MRNHKVACECIIHFKTVQRNKPTHVSLTCEPYQSPEQKGGISICTFQCGEFIVLGLIWMLPGALRYQGRIPRVLLTALSNTGNIVKGLWDHCSGPWDFSVKTCFAGEPSPFPGLVWNFGWTENSPSSRIASRDVRLVRTEAPGLRGGSAQPAPGPAAPQPENAAEMGSCGPGIKAQASLHPDFFFHFILFYILIFLYH